MKLILALAAIFSLTALSIATELRPPTPKEAAEFSAYFQRSGLLRKNHKVKELGAEKKAFVVIPHACKDGDDIYILSFDGGISLKTPPGETAAQYYAFGTGGAWTPVFRYSPKEKYFQFLGASVHRWPTAVVPTKNECPDIEIAVHGSHCGKAGFEDCRGKLIFNEQTGYSLKLGDESSKR